MGSGRPAHRSLQRWSIAPCRNVWPPVIMTGRFPRHASVPGVTDDKGLMRRSGSRQGTQPFRQPGSNWRNFQLRPLIPQDLGVFLRPHASGAARGGGGPLVQHSVQRFAHVGLIEHGTGDRLTPPQRPVAVPTSVARRASKERLKPYNHRMRRWLLIGAAVLAAVVAAGAQRRFSSRPYYRTDLKYDGRFTFVRLRWDSGLGRAPGRHERRLESRLPARRAAPRR